MPYFGGHSQWLGLGYIRRYWAYLRRLHHSYIILHYRFDLPIALYSSISEHISHIPMSAYALPVAKVPRT